MHVKNDASHASRFTRHASMFPFNSVNLQILRFHQKHQHVLYAIHGRCRLDDDSMPGRIWVNFNALDSSHQQTLWVNPIETGRHYSLADIHLLAGRDVFQLTAIVVEPANLSHGPRGLKHRTYPRVFVSDHLHHCEIGSNRDHSTDDAASRSHRHVALDPVERSAIDCQASKPEARVARDHVSG